MKNAKIEILPDASKDLQDIHDYICYDLMLPVNAENQLNRIENSIANLSLFPESHQLYPDEPWYSKGRRLLPIDNYIAFYIYDETKNTVSVLRIMYGGMNWSETWDNKE